MYVHTWKKYLPAIRILLKRSVTGEQILTMDRVDFEKINKSRKPICAFAMEMKKGRLSPFNLPIQGKELAEVLMADSAALALIRQNSYAISLSNSYKLLIKNSTPAEEMTSTETQQENTENTGGEAE